MIKIKKELALFSLLLFIYIAEEKVNSQEVCESYTNLEFLYEEENCSAYCCGTCDNRYCCDNPLKRLDQKSCVAENCLAYYDSMDVYHQAYDCDDSFCCGQCDYRFCCMYTPSKLNQSSCPNRTPTTAATKRTTTPYYAYSSSSYKYLLPF